MTKNVINNEEIRLEIDPLLDTAREGVTALETASSLIHIPTREIAKIQTAVKMCIRDRLYSISVDMLKRRPQNTPTVQ